MKENYWQNRLKQEEENTFIHFKHVSLKDNENNSILSPNVQTMTMPIDVDSNDDVDIAERSMASVSMKKSILI